MVCFCKAAAQFDWDSNYLMLDALQVTILEIILLDLRFLHKIVLNRWPTQSA